MQEVAIHNLSMQREKRGKEMELGGRGPTTEASP